VRYATKKQKQTRRNKQKTTVSRFRQHVFLLVWFRWSSLSLSHSLSHSLFFGERGGREGGLKIGLGWVYSEL